MAKYAAKKSKSTWHEASVASIEAAEDSPERWQSRTWEFTRLLKGRYPEASAEEIMGLVPWHETEFDEDDQAQFMNEWTVMRFIPGVEPLALAWQLAQETPFDAPKGSPYRRFPSYAKLLSLAAWLQAVVGENNAIFLPTRRVSEMIGVKSNKTVATLCSFAVNDGLMKPVKKHTRNRSTRYRVERLPRAVRKWIEGRKS
jgi:hypothetical protein